MGHSGTLIRTDNGVASYDACRDACIAEDTCELFTWHDTTTMGGPNTAASGDCELFSDDVAMSRLCDPTITKGVLTGRTCQNEERCQMGCGGFNECTGDGVNAASHNCADTAGTSCSDTAGGFTCDHSAASLGIATDGSATYDGHAAGMTTDASGNLVIVAPLHLSLDQLLMLLTLEPLQLLILFFLVQLMQAVTSSGPMEQHPLRLMPLLLLILPEPLIQQVLEPLIRPELELLVQLEPELPIHQEQLVLLAPEPLVQPEPEQLALLELELQAQPALVLPHTLQARLPQQLVILISKLLSLTR